jgi:hypothetical protein
MTMARHTASVVLPVLLAALACGEGSAPPPPPSIGTVPVQPVVVQPVPTGLVSVTVTATSNPPEAKVTGGGRPLGVTPLTTQVPIPAPEPGQPAPTFDFVFEKDGYETATIRASPVNGVINITAALAPSGSAAVGPGGTRELEIVGTGGGAITDFHTTTATVNVAEDCIVEEASAVLRGNHSYHQDLTVTLRAPTDQSFTLHNQRQGNPFRSHRVRGVEGKNARGEWTLRIRDDVERDTGRLARFALRLECR